MGAVMVVDGGYSKSRRFTERTVSERYQGAARIVLLGLALSAGAARADEANCGPVTNAFGPFDYRTATKEVLARVETFHFTPNVERLTRGETTAYVGGDIDYTLRAFPNHYRALMSMSKLSLQQNRPTPVGSKYSIECWFDRAFRFQPDDAMPRMVAGLYFTKLGRREEALENLALAAQFSDGNSNLHYNLGLAYLDLKMPDDALLHAKKAYDAGFPLPGLRNRLREAGAWRD